MVLSPKAKLDTDGPIALVPYIRMVKGREHTNFRENDTEMTTESMTVERAESGSERVTIHAYIIPEGYEKGQEIR